MKLITYGIGGFDPSKPNNNVISEVDLPDAPDLTIKEKLESVGLSIDDLKVALGLDA